MRGNLTKSIFSLFIILQILCSVSIAREDIENYGTYVLFPQGSVRVTIRRVQPLLIGDSMPAARTIK